LSRPGRRVFCIEFQLGGGCRVKFSHNLQRQRTIEPTAALMICIANSRLRSSRASTA
jgi:hypothetical protein